MLIKQRSNKQSLKKMFLCNDRKIDMPIKLYV